ncbi:M48 family metallopeptidase [Jiella sp. MQZ9-1]|uniref:M48 family metallopeptidase n=1 Tax=Jiella flava TaxID=2816857 RepID=A0A939FX03_9HYPH|nr:SprT family zinc-dependent metalloprotease [Jiella flava]MBO0662296.1 M48 family metallopeptidase [Jiella flava]MCD2470873.1 M48 family metallopeptidase [Jiella flava]
MPSLLRRQPDLALPVSIEIAGASLSLTVRHNSRAKRLVMRMAPGGTGVVVTAPKGMPARTIRAFLERHRGWVEERVARSPTTVMIAPDAIIPLRGEPTRLVHRGGRLVTRLEPAGDDDAALSAPIEIDAALFGAGEGKAPIVRQQLLVGGDAAHFSRRVLDYLRREARSDLDAAVRRHADRVGLEPRAITIKDTTSRWGSCTADRRLAFSWRIIMAPPFVLDYLAAHEVAHFRQMNHGPDFWALCETLCPTMADGKAWLKRHGGALHAIAGG